MSKRWTKGDLKSKLNDGTIRGHTKPAKTAVLFDDPEFQPREQKERSQEEFDLMKACVDLFDTMYPELEQKFFHIRNEERDGLVRAIMSLIGVRAGVWDSFLAVPRGGKGGLFIEFKVDTPLSLEQKKFYHLLHKDYHFLVVKSKDDFVYIMHRYLYISKRVNYQFDHGYKFFNHLNKLLK